MTKTFAICAAVLTSQVASPVGGAEIQEDRPSIGHMTLGYTYFNRAGADLASHNRELGECLIAASPMLAAEEEQTAPVDAAFRYSLLGSAILSAARRGSVASAIENCMVVYGWRVVRVSEAEGASLAALPTAELVARLMPWISAEQPHGDIVRFWRNDAQNGSSDRFALRPKHRNNGQLSLIAATNSNLKNLKLPQEPPPPQFQPLKAINPPQPPSPAAFKIADKWPKKPMKAEEIAALTPAGSAVLIINIKRPSLDRGEGLTFNRIGHDYLDPGAVWDGDPPSIAVSVGFLGGKKEGTFRAVAVPPGRWRLTGMAANIGQLNFCLGSPSFELKPGQVAFAGSFDMSAEKLGPDLDLTGVRQWLAGTAAANTVEAVVYTNGSRGGCRPNGIYAIEFEGAGFEPGYALGSKASMHAN